MLLLRSTRVTQPGNLARPANSRQLILDHGSARIANTGVNRVDFPNGQWVLQDVGSQGRGVSHYTPAYSTYDINQITIGTGDFTLFSFHELQIDISAGVDYAYVVGSNASTGFAFAQKHASIAGNAGLYIGGVFKNSGITATTTKVYKVVVSRINGVLYFYINDASGSVASSESVAAITSIVLNSYQVAGSFGCNYNVQYLTGLELRGWSESEARNWQRNPWSVFARRSNRIPLPVIASNNQNVTPSVGNLTITGYAPTVAQTANQSVLPAVGSLAFTGYAPTVSQSSAQAVNPAVGSVTITGNVPTVAQTANQAVLPSVGNLTVTGQVPTVTQSANQGILPAVGALTLTGQVPTVAQTAHIAVTPGVGSVVVTGYAPTVSQTSASAIIPAAGTITITGQAPTVAQSSNWQVFPDVGPVVITGYAPTVSQSVNQNIQPAVGSISFTGYAPTVTQLNGQNVIPNAGTLAITGYVPTVVRTVNNNVFPDVGTVVVTGYAPSVSRTTGGTGGASAADIWTYEIESGKTAEELMRMMAAVLLGKTTVTDLGGGLATVTFEAANGSKIRVTASMTNSVRTSVTYDDTF